MALVGRRGRLSPWFVVFVGHLSDLKQTWDSFLWLTIVGSIEHSVKCLFFEIDYFCVDDNNNNNDDNRTDCFTPITCVQDNEDASLIRTAGLSSSGVQVRDCHIFAVFDIVTAMRHLALSPGPLRGGERAWYTLYVHEQRLRKFF